MDIKKINEEMRKILEQTETEMDDSPILTPDNPDFDFYWDMVKDFDAYASKYESMVESSLHEALSTECGVELCSANIALIKSKKPQKYLDTFNKTQKIQWLIDYLNIAFAKDIIGFKYSGVGTIKYRINQGVCKNSFVIPIGKCYKNTTKLVSYAKDAFGVFHMKYGKNHHWQQSCAALLKIPTEFQNPVWVHQTKTKYNYVFYSSSGYTYAFGVPRNANHVTILISCY